MVWIQISSVWLKNFNLKFNINSPQKSTKNLAWLPLWKAPTRVRGPQPAAITLVCVARSYVHRAAWRLEASWRSVALEFFYVMESQLTLRWNRTSFVFFCTNDIRVCLTIETKQNILCGFDLKCQNYFILAIGQIK